SPLPPDLPDSAGGRAGGGVVPAEPSPDRNSEIAAGTAGGTNGGSSPSAGAGSGSGADKGNGLGISRGIPFGDVNGLFRGGDQNGGGGQGGGPGGAFGARSGGGGHFTLRRPSAPGPPLHIVYVIDISGSMDEGHKIDRARDAIKKALRELRP